MARFNDYRNALGFQQTLYRIGDLGGEPFLALQTPGVHFADAGNFKLINQS